MNLNNLNGYTWVSWVVYGGKEVVRSRRESESRIQVVFWRKAWMEGWGGSVERYCLLDE